MRSAEAPRKLRILFIGNSYIYANNLPVLLARLAEAAAGRTAIETHQVSEGGWTLERHWEDGEALQRIREGRWDYVVLQEQSQRPIRNREVMQVYARLLDVVIRKAGGRTVFYLTWARRDRPEDQAALTDAYLTIARELNAWVAPVGIAWQTALRDDPSLRLHNDDNSHPNPMGSYLAALVFLATLRGDLPHELPTTVLGLPEADLGKQEPVDLRIDPCRLPLLRAAALAAVEELRK